MPHNEPNYGIYASQYRTGDRRIIRQDKICSFRTESLVEAGKFWGMAAYLKRAKNFLGPRIGEGHNFWAPSVKTLGDVPVLMSFVL